MNRRMGLAILSATATLLSSALADESAAPVEESPNDGLPLSVSVSLDVLSDYL